MRTSSNSESNSQSQEQLRVWKFNVVLQEAALSAPAISPPSRRENPLKVKPFLWGFELRCEVSKKECCRLVYNLQQKGSCSEMVELFPNFHFENETGLIDFHDSSQLYLFLSWERPKKVSRDTSSYVLLITPRLMGEEIRATRRKEGKQVDQRTTPFQWVLRI